MKRQLKIMIIALMATVILLSGRENASGATTVRKYWVSEDQGSAGGAGEDSELSRE